MKKGIKLLFGLFFLFFCVIGTAQDVKELPVDPRIKSGKLANGLTYYIVKNTASKGYADFSIVQKVGTTLEERGQKGMFKALELLSMRGTRNFTDSTITQYLKSLGVKSEDILFHTGADATSYHLKNIPVANANTLDSALLILYNWLGSINIDEEDITRVMPLLKNTIADEWRAPKRLEVGILKELFPESPYASTLNPSEIRKLASYSSKDLRNFYYKWCRPDLQAVFIVGDVDPTALETQVKSLFATIPKPLGEAKRSYYTPDDFPGVKVVIGKDPEYDRTTVAIHLLKKPLSGKYKSTSVPYIEAYMDQAISTLLYNRIQDGIVSQNLPISNVRIEQGVFMEMQQVDCFSIVFETQPNRVYSAIAYLSLEMDRMARYGFNNQEFVNSRNIFYRELEALYDNRLHLGNEVFLKRVMNHYLQGYSLASIEMHFEIMKEILYSLSSTELNEYAKALVGQKDNILLTCKMPQVREEGELSKERMLASYREALAKNPSSYLEAGVVKWPKFVAQGPTATIISQITDPVTGAYVVILSNGVTALLKKTDGSKDTLSFKGVSKGGFSLMKGVNIGNEKYLNDIINLGGIGEISQPTLEKLFSYHNLSLKAGITPHTEYLAGFSDKSSTEKLFQAIYMSLTGRRADETAFGVYKKGKVYEAAYHPLSPGNVFRDSVAYFNQSNKKFALANSPHQVETMEYSPVLYASRKRLSNAADFVFIFAGDLEYDVFSGLVVKYLGGIPGEVSKKENWEVVPNYLAKGNLEKRFLHQMVIPRTYAHVTLSCGMPYNIENYVLAKVFDKYSERLYNNGPIKHLAVRNEVETRLTYYPEEILVHESYFETDSAGVSEILNRVDAGLEGICRIGVNPVLFAEVLREVRNDFHLMSRQNGYWLETIERRYMVGKDFHTNFLKTLGELAPQRFTDFVKQVKYQGNRVVVIMEGTTEDVKTRNLFKENKLIKDFFEL